MNRYSELTPLSIQEQIDITVNALIFFCPVNKKRTGLPLEENKLPHFLKWCNDTQGIDWWPKMHRITELFKVLCHKGCLHGNEHIGFLNILERTNIEGNGYLFLGKYLGKNFIADQIIQNLACITGKKGEDEHIGSGILISSRLILTCKHVLNDMKLDKKVKVNNKEYTILKSESHSNLDFGFILLETPVEDGLYHKDIALKEHSLLEEIVIAGFPKIPNNRAPIPIFQSGEINGKIATYLDPHKELLLFSAVARPGNSGGPILSHDGKILGIVIESLEREKEEVDNYKTTLPFFAAIPAKLILEKYSELEISKEHKLPWEDYQ